MKGHFGLRNWGLANEEQSQAVISGVFHFGSGKAGYVQFSVPVI